MAEPLDDYLTAWERKPVLRTVYNDFYDRIVAACAWGLTVEIGGGIGNLKQRLPNVVATDIQFAPWLDCVADAQHLPLADGTLSNVVMVDVLHHIEFPAVFFRQVSRALRPGGRIIMVEPAITWGSSLFYRLIHHEPVRMSEDPLAAGTPNPNRNPYESNQAIPTLIATRDRERFAKMFPDLTIASTHWFSFFVYPLTGGFKPWSLISPRMAQRVLRFERFLEPWLGRLGAFRMMLVVEKRG
jgi:SAM-dependent methyltransferase